jgi:hypothetical protein
VVLALILPTDGQRFANPVMEGLPTTRELIAVPMNYRRDAILSAASFDVITRMYFEVCKVAPICHPLIEQCTVMGFH